MSNQDFSIDIAHVTKKKVRLTVRANAPTVPAGGDPYDRKFPPPDLLDADLRELQSGEAPRPTIDNLTKAVSNWFSKGTKTLNLAALLGLFGGVAAAGNGNAPRWRLVFHVASDGSGNSHQLLQDLINVPIELLTLGDATPLVMNGQVSGMIHLLDKVSQPVVAATPRAGLRVLIVRSAPAELDGLVEKAAPLRQAILDVRPDLGGGLLRVDLLSREEPVGQNGVIGAPTRLELARRVEAGYDVLVYLGHGDLDIGGPVLLLESPDGTRADPYPASQFSDLFTTANVPVVMLVGCLTAALPVGEALPDDLKDDMVSSSRAGMGAAQALVNNATSVQVAVGMRARIANEDALTFLTTFFENLLPLNHRNVGNVEASIQAARSQLKKVSKLPSSWAAPVVFSTLPQEPLFPQLASTPRCPEDLVASLNGDKWLGVFSIMRGIPWSLHGTPGNPGLHENALKFLSDREIELVQKARDAGSTLLMPVYTEVPPGEQTTEGVVIEGAIQQRIKREMLVKLHDPLKVSELEGTVRVGQEDVAILGITRTDALRDAGYRVVQDKKSSKEVFFRIERENGAAGDTLPAADLLNIELALGAAAPAVYHISMIECKTDPPRTVCGGVSAVVLPTA